MRSISRLGLVSIAALASTASALAQEAPDDLYADEQYAVPAAEDESGIDWSVALRGSYSSSSTSGGQASVIVAPEASLTIVGADSRTVYDADAELVVDGKRQARFSNAHAGVETGFNFGPTTRFDGTLDATYSQDDAANLGPTVLFAPPVVGVTGQARLTQDLGRIDARLTLDGERSITGRTTLLDHSTVDNSDDSYWQGGATLRVGYELTPLVSAFVEGEAAFQKFDAPDPVLATYLDARRYELRAGLSYAKGSVLSAEASVGHGWLDYVNAGIVDTQSWVYNGSVTLRPDETLQLRGELETSLSPSETAAGDTDVAYALTGSAEYQVNPSVALRGSAAWNRTVTIGTGGTSSGYDLGAGVDYRASRHVIWTADYAYGHDEVPPAAPEDTHTVTVGVRVTR